MKNGKLPKMVWEILHSEADQTLGDRFWEDILELIPNRGPRIDVFQTEQHVVVVVELPGVNSPNTVNMKLKNSRVLWIKGEIPCDYPAFEGDISQSERFFGDFERKISLPYDVTVTQVRSVFNDGLLTVHLPKKQSVEEEQIPLKVTEE